MSLVEDIKKVAEKVTGWRRPNASTLAGIVRARRPRMLRFRQDKLVPNHPYWPLVVYRNAVRLDAAYDPAAVFEDLFARNGWGDAWRDGVYDYLHYHSRIHEVMGVCRGTASIRFGGSRGRKLHVKAGDVIVLPAGTGHQCLSSSSDFLVVGAYPARGTYDVCRPTQEDYERSMRSVPKIPVPTKDPVYGRSGPLKSCWKRRIAKSRVRKER